MTVGQHPGLKAEAAQVFLSHREHVIGQKAFRRVGEQKEGGGETYRWVTAVLSLQQKEQKGKLC